MKYNRLTLNRNESITAHIDEENYTVLFSPSEYRDSRTLFKENESDILRLQSRVERTGQKRTVTAYFVLTDKCNLKCEYCDVLGPSDNRGHGQNMSWEVAEKGLRILMNRLEEEPDLYAQVTFFGGEPTLAWALLARICEFIEKHPFRDRVAKMLVTNGTLIDTNRADFLLKHSVYVVVSLDGGPQVNDLMRPASYDGVAKGLDTLYEVMPGKFGISCTVGSHNAATLADEVKYLNERFHPLSIGLNIFHYQRNGSSPIDMSSEDLSNSLIEAFRIARRENIAIYQFIGILKAFAGHYRNLDYCPACVDKLLFSPSGNVGRCETLMDEPKFSVPLSEVNNHILPSHLDWTRYTPEHEPVCQDCPTRWICPGSCAYDMFVKTGNPAGVDERRCRFHTQLLVEMLDILYESSSGQHKGDIFIPDQESFGRVIGGMQTVFPPDTIWIVSLSNVTETSMAAE